MSAEADQSPRSPSRRNFIRLLGVAGGTAAVGASPVSPVQESEAIAPVVAAGAIGGAAAIGWALRETEVIGADEPPEGLTADGLHEQVRQTAKTRASTNASTFVDNENIIENLDHTLYSEGKKAAIKAINDGLSDEDVNQAAKDAIDDYADTIFKNLLKSWNESVNEAETLFQAIGDHPDASFSNSLAQKAYDGSSPEPPKSFNDYTEELPTGTEFTVREFEQEYGGGTMYVNPFGNRGGHTHDQFITALDDNQDVVVKYLNLNDWTSLYDSLKSVYNDTRDEIIVWADTALAELEAGDLDTEDLLTSREQADMTAEEEDFPQAIADLEALNIPVDYEREAEVYLEDIGATLYGRLGQTEDQTLETRAYDPDLSKSAWEDQEDPDYHYVEGDVYLTYDVSEGSGDWGEVETTVDGGTVIFTAEPFESSLYRIETTDGDTAEVSTSDFSENDSGNHEVDISDQIETATTEVDSVQFFSESDEVQYETIQLDQKFEILGFTDSDGNQYDESNFERSEPHDDTNYISKEEWEAQQERHEELIEKYEDAQGGGGVDLGQFDMFGIPGEVVALIALGLGAIGLSN